MKATSSVLLSLAIFVAAVCAELPAYSKRSGHAELAHKVRAVELELEERSDNHTMHKRAFGPARMTFYDVGLGACGWWNTANDYIVAVNSPQFGGYAVYPPAICGKQITISYNGKQVGAVAADECPTCGYGELDLSRGLFNNFATENDGVFYAEWWFNDGGSNPQPQPTTAQAPPTTTEQPQPQPSTQPSTPQPQPTTTTTQSTTTTQQQALPSTTSSSPEPASSSTTSSSVPAYESFSVANADPSSSALPPSSTPETVTPQNIQNMCSVVVQFGKLITQAAGRELTLTEN